MHICMLTDYFLPHMLGGTERAVYELGRQLIGKGCQITVITLNTDKAGSRDLIEGMNIYRLPAVSVTKLIRAQLTVSPPALYKVQHIVERVRPDIVHTHNLYFQLTMVAPFLKRFAHVPLVTTLHLPKMVYNRILLDSSINAYQRLVGNLIIRSSDRVIAVSRSVMKHAIADLGVPLSKVAFIPNGVDIQAFSPCKQEPSNTVVTYVGRLIENKGPQYLVEAGLDILKNHPEAHIYIIGDGPLKEKLLQKVASQKLGDRIHILGSVPDILPILRMTTVFVRPSITGEAISLAILEAMACGLPVVASNVEGNIEIVENGVNGCLVPPANSEALAEAIEFLLSNREAARAMGENARKTAERSYDWKKIAEQTLEVYASLT